MGSLPYSQPSSPSLRPVTRGFLALFSAFLPLSSLPPVTPGFLALVLAFLSLPSSSYTWVPCLILSLPSSSLLPPVTLGFLALVLAFLSLPSFSYTWVPCLILSLPSSSLLPPVTPCPSLSLPLPPFFQLHVGSLPYSQPSSPSLPPVTPGFLALVLAFLSLPPSSSYTWVPCLILSLPLPSFLQLHVGSLPYSQPSSPPSFLQLHVGSLPYSQPSSPSLLPVTRGFLALFSAFLPSSSCTWVPCLILSLPPFLQLHVGS